MHTFVKAVAFVVVALSCLSCPPSEGRSTLNQSAISGEQLQAYSDFLDQLTGTHFKYLSDTTFALDLSGVKLTDPCLKGIELWGFTEARRTVHTFGPGFAQGKPFKLVSTAEQEVILRQKDADLAAKGAARKGGDASGAFDAGVLSLSEVAFDKGGRFAIIEYAFRCGTHCKSGATLVLEKVGGRWSGKARRPCAMFSNDIHFRAP